MRKYSEDTKQSLSDVKTKLDLMSACIAEVLNGSSLTGMAEKLQITPQKLNTMIKEGLFAFCKPAFTREETIEFIKLLQLPSERLLRDVLGLPENQDLPSFSEEKLYNEILPSALSPMEYQIISLYYGSSESDVTYTLSEIGKLYNLSTERIRSIKVMALRKLRNRTVLKAIFDLQADNSLKEKMQKDITDNIKTTREYIASPSTEDVVLLSDIGLEMCLCTYNALKKHGIISLNEAAKMNDTELKKIRNLGQADINELNRLFHKYGFR